MIRTETTHFRYTPTLHRYYNRKIVSKIAPIVAATGGDDGISLSDGQSQEIIFQLAYDGSTITSSDGHDTVNSFVLKEDKLTFLDTDGDAASLIDILKDFHGVMLVRDNTDFTGLKFITEENHDSISIVFSSPLSETELETELGLKDIPDVSLGDLFFSGVPAGPSETQVTSSGLVYIDNLFGPDGIEVTGSLPVELI